MRTRLQDIAERAGVSVTTVSRVVNGKPGVAEPTRQAILRELEILGYEHPASQARAQSGIVGLIVPELGNPIFPQFVQELETALVGEGYTPLLCTATPVLQEDEYLTMLLDRNVAGLILVSGRHANTEVDHRRYHELVAGKVPVVFVNGYVEGLRAAFVSADDVGGTRAVVEHLRSLGHRRIGAAMGPARYISSQRKVEGFRQGMAAGHAAGSEPQRGSDEWPVVHSVYSIEGGQAVVDSLLDHGVTAIVCGSDLMALGAVRGIRARGLDVPADISVVGHDDSPLMAFTDPPLTTLRQNVPAMSRQAVTALMEEMHGMPSPRHELVFRTEVVVRESTGPPPEVAASR